MTATRVFRGAAAVRESLLRRRPLGVADLGPDSNDRLRRAYGVDLTPEDFVDRVFKEVADGGDREIARLTRAIDGVEPATLEVPSDELRRAYGAAEAELLDDLETAAKRIRQFHERTKPNSWFDDRLGLGQQITPIERVGIYAPGGTAAYPSSILMTVIPAVVAGVGEIIMCTPPGPSGLPASVTLAAASIAGVSRVFAVGGAQAVAGMTLGTETIPKVDKIAGPGNVFVVLAMRKAFGTVGVSLLPGPTETLIIADGVADPEQVAADMLAQAEHDVLASPLLLTDSADLAQEVLKELDRQLPSLPRKRIAAESLRTLGGVGTVSNLDEAADLANEYAPEHLCLLVSDPTSLARKIRNAGGVFLGRGSPEVLGDYVAGPSHVMPVAGTARFASPLNVGDFMKITSVFNLPGDECENLAVVAARLARAEGLEAHARAADLRTERSAAS